MKHFGTNWLSPLALTLIFALSSALGACRQQVFPPLRAELTPLDSLDSVVYIIYDGVDSMHLDSLPIQQAQPLELYPDTQLVRRVFLAQADFRSVSCYELRDGAWRQSSHPMPQLALDSLDSTAIYQLVGQDVKGKEQGIHSLIERGAVALVFSAHNLETPRPADRDSLLKLYARDSLTLVYMMLSASDSAVRTRLKQDSLSQPHTVAFSDSLGLVSRMRHALGLARLKTPAILIVEPDGRWWRYCP